MPEVRGCRSCRDGAAMTTLPRTPTTAAGQRFCEGPRPTGNWWKGVPDQIADIEAEAVAAERARIRAAVEDVPWSGDPYCCGELRAAVIALLDPRPWMTS